MCSHASSIVELKRPLRLPSTEACTHTHRYRGHTNQGPQYYWKYGEFWCGSVKTAYTTLEECQCVHKSLCCRLIHCFALGCKSVAKKPAAMALATQTQKLAEFVCGEPSLTCKFTPFYRTQFKIASVNKLSLNLQLYLLVWRTSEHHCTLGEIALQAPPMRWDTRTSIDDTSS